MNRSCSTADLLFNLLDFIFSCCCYFNKFCVELTSPEILSHALLQRADKMSKRELGRKFTYSLVRKVSVTKYIENRE